MSEEKGFFGVIVALAVLQTLIGLSLLVGVVWVAIHFISKFW